MSACVFKNASPIYTYSSIFLAKYKEKKGVKDLHNIVYKTHISNYNIPRFTWNTLYITEVIAVTEILTNGKIGIRKTYDDVRQKLEQRQ